MHRRDAQIGRRTNRKAATAFVLAVASLAVLLPVHAQAAPLPKKVGRCAQTTVRAVLTRLEDNGQPVKDSGSAVQFANGGYQVSYDTVPAIDRSRRGDPVNMCLVSLPSRCPKGDNHGKVYRTTNMRTKRSWTLPDAEHLCGGA